MKQKIWVCDDEAGMQRYLAKMLSSWGHQVETFASPLPLLRLLADTEATVDLLLLDLKMPEMDGLEALRRIREVRPGLPILVMTGHGTIASAVEAMKLGAYDYLTKPFPQEKLFAQIQHCLEQERLRSENVGLKKELDARLKPVEPVFASQAFGEVYELALRVAASDASALILGESGTGKELIARSIHYGSVRASGRFLAINCAALSDTLLESQLFGHVKGAFTGAVQAQKGFLEEADGGTLFLDEVGDLSSGLQAKLLRVLQEGEFIPVGSTRTRRADVRFVAATNKDLEAEVARGTFREDLYYRLNVIALTLPPLRERPEDIEPLVRHFLDRLARRRQPAVNGITAEALRALQAYHWPGNVRELENVIERGVILARGHQIDRDDLPLMSPKVMDGQAQSAAAPVLTLREAEQQQVLRALRQTDWNKSQAALLLGITRKTLDRKIKDFELSRPSLDPLP